MSFKTAHAFSNDIMGARDATAMAELVRTRAIIPEELIEAAIARAQKVEPALNAIVTDCFAAARQRAVSANSGAFAGVPTFIKDMLDVAGLPTRWGSPALEAAPIAAKTERLAQDMFDMGMVNLGKSSMPEFGFTPSTEFVNSDDDTHNPWNLDHTAGGSSGGAAALVAAGVVPIAHAADGGGSIRIPAASCGLVGLKPSRGRLRPTRYSAHQIVGITADGVVTRSARDQAMFYAEAAKQYRNARLKPIGNVRAPLDRPLHICATMTTPVADRIDSASTTAFEKSVALAESLGHHVEVTELPVDERLEADFRLYWAFNAAAVARVGRFAIDGSFERERLTLLTDGLDSYFRANLSKAPAAFRRLRRSSRAYDDLFNNCDAILTPTLGHVSPPLGYLGMDQPFERLFERMGQWACFTPYASATGGPAITLPLHHDATTNVPVGTMFMAGRGEDGLLLRLALQFEEASPPTTLAA